LGVEIKTWVFCTQILTLYKGSKQQGEWFFLESQMDTVNMVCNLLNLPNSLPAFKVPKNNYWVLQCEIVW
jgi:hypothetical protein